MMQHYIHDSCTPEWLREQLTIEREATIDGEYDHEYVSGLHPNEFTHKVDTRPALQRIIESERKVKYGDHSER